ncbi:hypothetical protein D3C80_1865710 [compost metagenome]
MNKFCRVPALTFFCAPPASIPVICLIPAFELINVETNSGSVCFPLSLVINVVKVCAPFKCAGTTALSPGYPVLTVKISPVFTLFVELAWSKSFEINSKSLSSILFCLMF